MAGQGGTTAGSPPDGPTCSPPGAAPGFAYTLTILAFVAHNVEEVIGLPGWAEAHGIALTPAHYANAVIYLALGVAVLLLAGRMLQFALPLQRVVAVATAALMANAVSHVVVSLVTWSLQPGVFTAVLLVLPSAAWLFARLPLARREKRLAGVAGVGAMPLVAGGALWLAGGLT